MRELAARVENAVPGAKRRLVALVAIALLAGLLEAVTMVSIIGVVARNLDEGDRVNLVIGTVDPGVAVAVAIAGSIVVIALHALAARATADLAGSMLFSMRAKVLDSFRHATWARQSVDREAAIQEGVSTLSQRSGILAGALANVAAGSTAAVALCAVAVVVDPIPALAAIGAGLALAVAMRPLAGRSRQLANEFHAGSGEFSDEVTQYSTLAREFRAFGVDEIQHVDLHQRNAASTRTYRRLRFNNRLTSYVYKDMAIILLAIAVAGLYSFGSSDVARLGAVFVVLIRSLVYAQQAQTSYQVLMEEGPAMRRLEDYVASLEADAFVRGNHRIDGFRSIRFQAMSYVYPDGRPALEDVDIGIERGEFVGIIGPSGGGKSTLLEILLGLRDPTSGHVAVDGHELSDIEHASWAGLTTFVPQDARLLRASILENIVFGRPWIDRDTATRAAIAAHLDSEVRDLPNAYDTMLGPRGVGLSGGQQQRLAIARALAGEPELLVLDEPTSALDPEAEQAVKQTIDELRGEMTLVVVAHRASTLESCHRVWAVHDGSIIADSDLAGAQRALSDRGAKADFIDAGGPGR